MNKPDRLRPKLVDPRGVLHQRMTATSPGYGRFWPDEDLAPFVEHLWTVAWDLEVPTVSEVLAHPSVQLVVERDASAVAGVFTGRFVRRLEGSGRVLGVKFLPGGFRPFLDGPVSALTDRRLSLTEIFGSAADDLERRALAAPGPEQAFAVIQEFLRARRPVAREAIGLVGRIVERAANDRGITRVAQLVAGSGLAPRQLQRLFDEYVGVRPKWVIQRYRLHEAAERIAASPEHDWAELALELGFADQAHFVRDFRRFVGSTPAAYARSLPR
ncbi:MAG: helix-turn-helix domain-containing protein [Thermoanaerobaculia bacterium]|nr:helix-turn-helix domain-containing protein [Thermoanaerobaculia bacterium]MBP9825771.1 helix-turn-helix domain-containing protein [Thermoanaerobaculia bacterium]